MRHDDEQQPLDESEVDEEVAEEVDDESPKQKDAKAAKDAEATDEWKIPPSLASMFGAMDKGERPSVPAEVGGYVFLDEDAVKALLAIQGELPKDAKGLAAQERDERYLLDVLVNARLLTRHEIIVGEVEPEEDEDED